MIKILFVLNALLLSNIQEQMETGCPTRILIFYLPMEKDYYVALNPEDLFVHGETKILESEDRNLVRSFSRIFKCLPKYQIVPDCKYIDVKVLIELFYKNGEIKMLALDRFGHYMINDTIFKKDIKLLKLIEDNFTEIRWGKYVYQND